MVQHRALATARFGTGRADGAALSRQRGDAALCRNLSFRQPGRAELLGLENRRQHALDRAHAAAFPRPPAHRRPTLQPEINVTAKARSNKKTFIAEVAGDTQRSQCSQIARRPLRDLRVLRGKWFVFVTSVLNLV